MDILPIGEATRRLRADRELLLTRVEGRGEEELTAEYRVDSGPLGDFCASLHDLVAHVLMWDEINLAVLSEAAAGRAHWSLDARWETPDAGRILNRAGVEAGREIPSELLLHRLGAVHDAVLAEFGRIEPSGAALAQRVWTVPGRPAYWHAAIHLGRLPEASS
ncbi:hypothetical protein [Actinoallomurus sp. CA-142502]|uniref:hypothetical protein n=1 Tax=Actinoallomurus sp. CA-142502 TaxID=3239885 RepID=UPI003D936866